MKPLEVLLLVLAAAAASGCTKDLSELGMGAEAPTGNAAGTEEGAEPPSADTAAAAAATPAHAPGACNCPHNTAPVQPLAPGQAAPEASDGGAAPVVAVAPTGSASGSIKGIVTTPPRLSSAVVYVEDAPSDPSRGMKEGVNQARMQFVPHFVAVSVGGKVIFYNGDPFPHNVFSPDHGGFNLGTWGKGGSRVYTFKQPGIYSLLCNLHPGMLAYVAAVPSSYYDAVDRKGAYEIKGVPNGKYKLTATGPKLTQATKTVEVAGGEVSVDFALEKSK
jgi:plastocyanin